jgi:hypothetical protein
MAVVYIQEYAEQARDNNARTIPAGQEPPVTSQTVAIGGASVQSSAFNAKTCFVRIHTDAICSVKFGSNPTVTATDARLAANTTEFFGVRPGEKVAVITNV